jgi:alginate O-acetyltransferase complex protein AlgJ
MTRIGNAAAVVVLAWGLGSLSPACGGEAADAKTLDAFRADCAAKAASAEKAATMTVVGKEGWLFLGKELRHVSLAKFWGEEAVKVSQARKPENADPLPAILDFKAQLDKAGIELMLVPVPPKAVIYPDMLSDAVKADGGVPPRLNAAGVEFYAVLRTNGVKVLDLTDEFLAHRFDKEGAVFCKQDTHWSGRACALAAKSTAREIKGRPWLNPVPELKLEAESRAVKLGGDLWQALTGDRPAAETIPLRFVSAKEGEFALVEPDTNSPVLLLGDSYTLIFHAGGDMQAAGAGLADQLALELGIAVDLIGVRGSGATPARVNLLRRVRGDADYLSRKKLVVWCFGAREFTEADGWSRVPIAK